MLAAPCGFIRVSFERDEKYPVLFLDYKLSAF